MTDTIDIIDHRLRRYIERQHSNARDGNQADHRPTYQAELDDITQEALKLHARSEELMKDVTGAEKAQCNALMQVEFGEMARFQSDKFVRMKVLGRWIIGPAYLSKLAAARFLQPFFTSATEDA